MRVLVTGGTRSSIRDRDARVRAADLADAIGHTAALVTIGRARRTEFDDIDIDRLRNVIGATNDHRTTVVAFELLVCSELDSGFRG